VVILVRIQWYRCRLCADLFVLKCGRRGKKYYPFEKAFYEQVNPGIFTLLETYSFLKLLDIHIKVGTTKSLNELCMGDSIYDAVFYFFGLDQELLLGPKEQWPK
jgi:hypothetical protein